MKLTIKVLILILAVTSSALAAASQIHIKEEQAETLFEQLGCTGCHNGQTAATFNQILGEIGDWSSNYASLDEAISNEVTYFGGRKFNSFDELMETMAGNVGKSPDTTEIQELKQFFLDVFQSGGIAITTTTTTQGGATAAQPTGSGPFYMAVAAGVILAVILLFVFSRR